MKLKIIILLTGLFYITNVNAQDPNFSLPYSIPHELNPAMTGISGGYNFGLKYRSQWKDIQNVNYETVAGSFDMPFYFANSESGTGLYLSQDKANGFNTTVSILSFSYDAPLGGSTSGNHIRSGLQAMMTHKKINFEKIKFADQYTGNGTFNNVTQETIATNKGDFNYDANFGILWYKNDPQGIVTKIQPWFGAVVHRINFSSDKKFGETGDISARYLVHGGMNIRAGSSWNIKPAFIFSHQNLLNQTQLDLSFQYLNKSKSGKFNSFSFGSTYRTEDAQVFYIGLEFQNTRIAFGYDYILSDLRSITPSGGFEISCTFLINKYPRKTAVSSFESQGEESKTLENSKEQEKDSGIGTRWLPFPR